MGKLLYAPALGYAGMRPEGIESNLFAYHLQQLITGGLIAKRDSQYALTPAGLSHIDRLSHEKMTPRLQPHIVTAIDITTDSGQTLLFARTFQPYIYRLGFPLGKVHYEEDIATAAARELEEKSGLTDIALAHKGMVYIEAKMEGRTISKILCHVFQGRVAKPLVTTRSHRGECLWMDHRELDNNAAMPGFHAIKTLLQNNGGLFFAEITEDIGPAPIPKM